VSQAKPAPKPAARPAAKLPAAKPSVPAPGAMPVAATPAAAGFPRPEAAPAVAHEVALAFTGQAIVAPAVAVPPRAAPRQAAAASMPHAPVSAATVTTHPAAPVPPVAAAAAPPLPTPKPEPIEFAEGDHVVYPTHGVGKVMGIVNEEIAGHKLQLIVVTFDENRMTLRVPVAKARSSGLRKLASRKLLDAALATLKGRARIKRTMWSRRAQEYEAKINSGDPVAIAEVVRDLHRNAGQPDQSFSERQIYEAALDRLASELAAIERIDKPAASEKLAGWLKAA
jgi:CarD family transcriptional regulator